MSNGLEPGQAKLEFLIIIMKLGKLDYGNPGQSDFRTALYNFEQVEIERFASAERRDQTPTLLRSMQYPELTLLDLREKCHWSDRCSGLHKQRDTQTM
jgi:hypothetical protein